MAILPLGLLGAMGAFHAAQRTISQGAITARAMGMVESRIEAKRSVRWDRLLQDDLDHDGNPDVVMRDDGQEGDLVAGDQVYTAVWEQDQVRLIWTVAANHSAPIMEAGSVVIEVIARFPSEEFRREVRSVTVRANPAVAGP
jgi:hypothetical protein